MHNIAVLIHLNLQKSCLIGQHLWVMKVDQVYCMNNMCYTEESSMQTHSYHLLFCCANLSTVAISYVARDGVEGSAFVI